jgi:SAM-dependent methyltransferase
VSVAEWWHEMFALPPWQTVQLGWESLEDADQQIEPLIRATGLETGMRVLDVPCGTGRIAKRLMARGFDVLGVDITERFLDEARAAGVSVVHGDMRELGFDAGFDVALCMWGSFGYFDDEGNLGQARAACRSLRPGGRYLIDTVAAESLLANFRERDWFTAGDIDVLERRSYAVGTGRIETEWTFLHDGDRRVQSTSVRVYTVRELADLLARAGFTSFAALDDDLEPFEVGARRLWMVATR